MTSESRTAKASALCLLLAGIVWLGGINIRAMVAFDLLIPGTIDFKANIHPYVERAVYELIAQASLIVDIAYIVVWISGIVFLRSTVMRLREHGWLMMSAILFYVFTPVEIYTMVLDAKIWYLDHIGSFDLVEFRTLFIHRLAALAGAPMIALLCYYTVVVLAVFRPMRRTHTAHF